MRWPTRPNGLMPSLVTSIPETKPVASDCHAAAAVFKGKTWLLTEPNVDDYLALMQTQLYLAGVRLAAVLNVAAQ